MKGRKHSKKDRSIAADCDARVFVGHVRRRVRMTVLGHSGKDNQQTHSAVNLDEDATEKLIGRLTRVLHGMRQAAKKRAERRNQDIP